MSTSENLKPTFKTLNSENYTFDASIIVRIEPKQEEKSLIGLNLSLVQPIPMFLDLLL
jgi:hypothetical protein